ncbi:hypothetical protein BC831DRAFT_509516 [Entophlyctis helioformis]|nr:hypothetical protein BC831DRAFT_509516 [Entophlyctis helioformis]
MSSLSSDCTEVKDRYDTCFNKWYAEKFLKGDTTPACDELFKQYRECVWKAIHDRQLDTLIADATKGSVTGAASAAETSSL